MFDLKSARHWAQSILSQVVKDGSIVVDATMGNGYDTEFLCRLVGEEGRVFAFDVQHEALLRTSERLEIAALSRHATLIHEGHERVADYVAEPIDAAVFNLGWLPGADKQITTREQTTLPALHACIGLLKRGGVITVCVYPGHGEGERELGAVLNWAKSLDAHQYHALHQGYLNQKNEPPQLIAVQKR